MPRVLIVEDEAVLRLTFSQFLEGEGYGVDTAEDYDEAVHHLNRDSYDVVVTDIILAGKTGVDLLRTARERGLDLPVIMITGEPNIESASEAVRLGAFDYLAKPVTRDSLTRVVRLAYDRKRLAEERDHFAAQMDVYRRDLEAIFNSVNEGIITVDEAMRIRQVNSAAGSILNLAARSFRDRPFESLLPGRMDDARRALETTLKTKERVGEHRIALTLDNQEERMLVFLTVPLFGEGGFAGAALMIRDITRLVNLEQQVQGRRGFRDMIGKSMVMQDVFALIRQLADTDSTVLVRGESGTGKELVAAALHYESQRSDRPFIKVNCAALSENILESELFGHVKGAFTGAVKDRMGRFEAANGGTILLDEIGDVSPRLQLRLLRVLQEREFERVGDSVPIKTDVRVIASTNQDLERRIQEGEFRQDLYYRLNVVRMDLPPLRERRSDIPLFVDHFCKKFNAAFKKEIVGAAPATMETLMRYAWPGNVRELENCMERAFIVCNEAMIGPKHLPAELLEEADSPFQAGEDGQGTPGKGGGTRERIVGVLTKTDWNVAKAARRLGIARNTLYQKMKGMNIVRPAESKPL